MKSASATPGKRTVQKVMPQPIERTDGLGFLDLLRAHFWMAGLVGLVAGAATSFSLLREVPEYEAKNILLIQLGRDYAYVPDAPVSGLRTPDPGDLELYFNAEIQLLNSSPVREVALERLLAAGAMKIGPDATREDLLDELDDASSINLITGSHLVDVRVRSEDPALAKAIATALADAYLETRNGMIGTDTPAFLKERIEIAEQKITSVDEAILGLTGSSSAETGSLPLDRLVEQKLEHERDLTTAKAEVVSLTARLESLRALVPAPAGDPTDRVITLVIEAQVDLAAATARVTALEAAGEALAAELVRAEAASPRLAALIAERRTNLDALAQLQSQLVASELAAARNAAGLGTVRVIEKGLLNPNPVGLPDRIKWIAGIAVALLAGLVAVFAFELLTGKANRGRREAG